MYIHMYILVLHFYQIMNAITYSILWTLYPLTAIIIIITIIIFIIHLILNSCMVNIFLMHHLSREFLRQIPYIIYLNWDPQCLVHYVGSKYFFLKVWLASVLSIVLCIITAIDILHIFECSLYSRIVLNAFKIYIYFFNLSHTDLKLWCYFTG